MADAEVGQEREEEEHPVYELPVMGEVRVGDDVAAYLFTKYGIVT